MRAAQGAAAAITCVALSALLHLQRALELARPAGSPDTATRTLVGLCISKDVHASCQSPAALHRPTPQEHSRARNARPVHLAWFTSTTMCMYQLSRKMSTGLRPYLVFYV